MRIGFDVTGAMGKKSGVGYYAYSLSNALAKIVLDDDLLCLLGVYFRDKSGSDCLPCGPQVRQRLFFCPKLLTQSLLYRRRIVPVEFLTGRLDVFHNPGFLMPNTVGAKRVITIHDLAFYRYPESQTREVLDFHSLIKRALKKNCHVIAVSDFSKREIVDVYGVDENRITAISNGVMELEKLDVGDEMAEIDKKLDGRKFFIFAGNMEPRKNLIRMIKAYNSLPINVKREYPLVVVGGRGWQNEEIRSLLEESRSFIFTFGYVGLSMLAGLYRKALALVYVPIYEGFGFPPLEMARLGGVSVVSDIQPLNVFLKGAGIFVDPWSVESIAHGMEQAICIDRVKLGLLAKSQVAPLTWENCAKSTYDVYRRCSAS